MAPTGFRLGEFIVEPGTDRLLGPADGARVELEPKTMAVLLALVEREGCVVSSDELIHLVWHDRPMGANPVYKSVAKLRRALHDEADEPRYIETISRKGYRLLVAPSSLAKAPGAVTAVAEVPEPSSVASRQAMPADRHSSRFAAAALAVLIAAAGTAFVSRTVRAPASPPPVATAPTRAIAVPRNDPVVMALPFEARQTYLLARSELENRQWGFPLRLRQDAEDLIRAEPGFAPGHALRAIACTFRAVHARKSTTAASATPAIDGVEALECARQSSQRALQLDPGSAQVLAASGLLAWTESQQCESPCDQRGLMDAAQASLEQAVRRDPSLPEARTWLGMVYQARGDLTGAAAQAEASVALDPLNPVATYNANNFRMARGEFAKVRASLLAAMRRSDVPWFIVGQLVENALAAGDQQDALRWTRELTRYDDVRTAQLLATVAYARLEHPKEARSALAASGDGSDIENGDDLGYALWAHQLLDGSDGVRAFLRRQQHARREAARATSEEDQRWWLEIQGLAYALSGEAARAVGPLEAVLGASGLPRMRLGDATIEADFANALAWAYRETGRPERAREVAEGALATLDRVAAMGFDHDGGFALTHALALELAGHRELAQFQASRAVARGRARPVDFNTDPRWHGLMDAGAVALADSAEP